MNFKKKLPVQLYFAFAGILLFLLTSWLYQMLFDPAANIPWFIPFLPILGGLLFPKKLFMIPVLILIAGGFTASLFVPTSPSELFTNSTGSMLGGFVIIFFLVNPVLTYIGSTGHKDVFEWMYKKI